MMKWEWHETMQSSLFKVLSQHKPGRMK